MDLLHEQCDIFILNLHINVFTILKKILNKNKYLMSCENIEGFHYYDDYEKDVSRKDLELFHCVASN